MRTGQRGAQARIVLKLEALTNPALIEALLEAGRAGAQIDLIVRGACLGQRVIDECLVPYLHDCRDAWAQQGDGSYTRVAQDGVSAQQALMQLYAQD